MATFFVAFLSKLPGIFSLFFWSDGFHWSLFARLVLAAYLAKFVFPALVLQIKTPFRPKA